MSDDIIRPPWTGRMNIEVHFVTPEQAQGNGWHTVCGWDVQDLPEDHSYTLRAWQTTCESCKRSLVFLP